MTRAEIRFAADAMLQSMATWLRLLGYDCLAAPDQFGRRLLERAVAENRVFLTRNTHLTDNLPHVLLAQARIAKVVGERLPEQLREVVAKYALTSEQAFTRCLACNEPLQAIGCAAAIGSLPPAVAASQSTFWRCGQCGKVFWRGSHVRDSLRRLRQWLGGKDRAA